MAGSDRRGRVDGACQLAAAAPAAAPCTEPLHLGFNDSPFPPLLCGRDEPFVAPDPGWNVTVAREAARRLGCRFEAVRVPTRRLIARLERGEVDFAFLFGPTPERLRAMRFPLDTTYALARGWSVEPISAVDSVAPMLRGRRFDAVILTSEALTDAELAGPDARVELQPEVDRLYFHAPSSPAFPARNEAPVWRYGRELCVASRKYFPRDMPARGTH